MSCKSVLINRCEKVTGGGETRGKTNRYVIGVIDRDITVDFTLTHCGAPAPIVLCKHSLIDEFVDVTS